MIDDAFNCGGRSTSRETVTHSVGIVTIFYRLKKLFSNYKCCYLIITLHACARGKAIGFMSVVTIIARSRVLGICACCSYHRLVDIGEKLVSVCFELLNMAH